MSLSDEEFRLRNRQARAPRRRPPRREAAGPFEADPDALPVVREMVGKQVKLRWPDGREQACRVRVPVVVGDRVTMADGFVSGHAPRETELRRGGKSGIRVVCANADALLIVAATQEPPFRPGLVDRMLVAASAGGMEAAIILNKCDEGMPEEVLEKIARYEALGIPCFLVSATQQKGLEGLREWLDGRVSVLAGHSGVGKSTLLSALIPGVVRPAGELDEWGRGRHTTTGASTFEVPSGGELIDLPGVREYGVEFVLKEELRHHFVELAELRCKFADCLHDGEEGCRAEEVCEADRLDSYRKLLEELV